MCKPIVETAKDLILGSSFYVAKGIVEIEAFCLWGITNQEGVLLAESSYWEHYWYSIST